MKSDVQKDSKRKEVNVSCNSREGGLSHDPVERWVARPKGWMTEGNEKGVREMGENRKNSVNYSG